MHQQRLGHEYKLGCDLIVLIEARGLYLRIYNTYMHTYNDTHAHIQTIKSYSHRNIHIRTHKLHYKFKTRQQPQYSN